MARGAWMRANHLTTKPHKTVIRLNHNQRKNRELRRKNRGQAGRCVAMVAERGTRNRPGTPQTLGESPKRKRLEQVRSLNGVADERNRKPHE